MSWSLCTCNMPDFQHAICPVHDVPATAGEAYAKTVEPEVPFSLPLKPDGLHRTGDINDASGKLVAQVYISEFARDYVIAAVNSYEELKRQIADLKKAPRFNEAKHIERMVAAGCLIDWNGSDLVVKNERAETAEQQKEELLKALGAMNALFDDEGYFNELAQDQLSAALELSETAIAKYKRGGQQ